MHEREVQVLAACQDREANKESDVYRGRRPKQPF